MQRAIILAAAILVVTQVQAETAPRDLAFDIFRKGELIGSHTIEFKSRDAELEVDIDIRLLVKLLFVPVYRYEHSNREIWRDGRLLRIESRTDDDGEDFFVKGAVGPEGFRVESSEGSYVAPEDVISTSWWNFETVNRRKLLNSQLGELMAVEVQPGGDVEVETAAGAIPARRYVVDGEAKLELWYDRDHRLAKIRFAGSDGVPIEYRRRD
jgi:hypothetical protein